MVVFSDDSEDFSLVSDVVDEVVRSGEEDAVTEVCEGVSVTVTTSSDWNIVVVTVVWIPKSLSDRSATSDIVGEQQRDADVAKIKEKEARKALITAPKEGETHVRSSGC